MMEVAGNHVDEVAGVSPRTRTLDVVPVGSSPRRLSMTSSESSPSDASIGGPDDNSDSEGDVDAGDSASSSGGSGSDRICIRWKDLEFRVRTETPVQRLRRRVHEGIRRRLPCFGGDDDEGVEGSGAAADVPARDRAVSNVMDLELGQSTSAEKEVQADKQRGQKTVLYPSSGVIRSGKLTALMGSSGAGKTSFLNALSHQLHTSRGSHLSGEVMVFGEKLSKKAFKKYCGYVWQEDLLMPHLTVEETLMFYAHIRLPPSMSMSAKKQRVEETMNKLGLSHRRNSLVGDARVRGISGGEKRRVSIAVELIKNPQVLFLDEPTSGLDARTSLTVMQTLRSLAHDHNHTVLCTIHQPRSQIFDLFDDLFLMAQGHIVFTGRARDALTYFEHFGLRCPQFENPADFFIDMLTVDTGNETRQKETAERVRFLIDTAEENRREKKEDETASDSTAVRSRDRILRAFRRRDTKAMIVERREDDDKGHSTEQAGFIRATLLLLLRTVIDMLRDRMFMMSRVLQSCVMAIAVSVLWWQMDTDQSAIQDRLSVLFLILMAAAFPESLAGLAVFARDRGVFQRERAGRMYNIASYYLAKTLANLPLQIIVPLLLSTVTYWTVGLQSDFMRFLVFTLTLQLATQAMTSLSMALGAALPLDVASVLSPVGNLFMFLLGGFYVNPENMPTWIKWTKYGSVFYYANAVLIENEFDGRDFYCKEDQYRMATVEVDCGVEGLKTGTTRTCEITNGQQVIDQQSADELPIWASLVIMGGFVVLFRLIVFLALKYTKPRR